MPPGILRHSWPMGLALTLSLTLATGLFAQETLAQTGNPRGEPQVQGNPPRTQQPRTPYPPRRPRPEDLRRRERPGAQRQRQPAAQPQSATSTSKTGKEYKSSKSGK